MTKENLLQIEGLRLSRGPDVLLTEVSLALKAGECLTVVGANGAGKTTLLKVIAGLLSGYEGSVRLEGSEVKSLSPQDLSHIVGLVPQRLSHLPPFSVEEFLELSGPDRLSQGLSLVAHLGNRLLTHLSGGELQRVLIAGAVAQGASLLLLDEPTANVDPRGRRQIEDVLSECRKTMGLSYILVTHDVSFGMRNAETVAVMREGAVTTRCSASDPGLIEKLSEAYGCHFVEVRHDDLPYPAVVSL